MKEFEELTTFYETIADNAQISSYHMFVYISVTFAKPGWLVQSNQDLSHHCYARRENEQEDL